MGLDMYLHAKKLIGGNSRVEPVERQEYQRTLRAVGLGGLKVESKWLAVTVCLMYWRKANQIHRFFVQTAQGGADECKMAGVTRDQLFELLQKCRAIQQDTAQAPELLPTQQGFFFGSTRYDDDYFADIVQTTKSLEIILANEVLKDGWRFTYQSSW